MDTSDLTENDFKQIFFQQPVSGTFRVLAVSCSGLNYLQALKRTFADSQLDQPCRQKAAHDWLTLEPRLYWYTCQNTPLSIYDAGYKEEMKAYIRLRTIWLDAADCTFMRHRHVMLMDLLRVCHNDICQCLPTRDIMANELEKQLFHEYLLYDMGLDNTRFVGREAVSNGYHECDFTLEIEDIMKEPHQAIPRTRFRYLKRSLSESRMARCCAQWLYEHRQNLRRNHWIVDETAIEKSYDSGDNPEITDAILHELEQVYCNI